MKLTPNIPQNIPSGTHAQVRCWTVPKGSAAPQAAGAIHTDFEKCVRTRRDRDRSRGGARRAGAAVLTGSRCATLRMRTRGAALHTPRPRLIRPPPPTARTAQAVHRRGDLQLRRLQSVPGRDDAEGEGFCSCQGRGQVPDRGEGIHRRRRRHRVLEDRPGKEVTAQDECQSVAEVAARRHRCCLAALRRGSRRAWRRSIDRVRCVLEQRACARTLRDSRMLKRRNIVYNSRAPRHCHSARPRSPAPCASQRRWRARRSSSAGTSGCPP